MKSTIKLLAPIIILILTNCNQGGNTNKTSNADKQSECKPYFQFDKIDYYAIDIDEDKIWAIEEKHTKTRKETRLLELLIQYTPEKLSDTVVLKKIEYLGYKKTEIPKTKFEKINEIFCERKHKEALATTCMAIYRDILVFKKANKIIGLAKLCFDCDKSIITGTDRNTEEFGQSGDFGKLYKILK